MGNRTNGFTVIELLVVIVVIGILATITIVSFNGVQQRARLVVAQVDLANLSKQLELYKIDKGSYPIVVTNTSYSMDDMATVLKDAKLYSDTRGSSQRKKSFIYCVDSSYANYIIAAVEPIQGNITIPLGETLYYSSSLFNGSRTMTATTAGSSGANICKSISNNDNFLAIRWSFDTPLPGSP